MRIWLAAMCLVLASCEPSNSDYQKSFLLQVQAERAVKDSAKDPESVTFREFIFDIKRNIVCGEFNGKNSFGAMAGYNQFIYENGLVSIPSLYDSNSLSYIVKCGNAISRDLLSRSANTISDDDVDGRDNASSDLDKKADHLLKEVDDALNTYNAEH